MTSPEGTNTVPLHKARAGEHLSFAKDLIEHSPEWCRVSAFYSAYHTMKTAMLEDSVFDSASKLAAINPTITMSSRFVVHHNGGENREPGITEVVRAIYRPFYAPYKLLHGASISVRYGDGSTLNTAEQCVKAASDLLETLNSGQLKYKAP